MGFQGKCYGFPRKVLWVSKESAMEESSLGFQGKYYGFPRKVLWVSKESAMGFQGKCYQYDRTRQTTPNCSHSV